MKKLLKAIMVFLICNIWGHAPERRHKQKAKYNTVIYCKRCGKKLRNSYV